MARSSQPQQRGKQEQAPPHEGGALRIRTREGVPYFRRAGRLFTAEPREIPLTELSEADIERLRDEPMLVVESVTKT